MQAIPIASHGPRACPATRAARRASGWVVAWGAAPWLPLAVVAVACAPIADDVTPPTYVCGFSSSSAGGTAAGSSGSMPCGAGDPKLPPEPTLPTSVCQTLVANKSTPDESNLDTTAIQTALSACAGQGAVKLTSTGSNNVFISGHLTVRSTILWVDAGVTLYASRDPAAYQADGNCGLLGISDSSGCLPLLTVTGTSPGVVGDGVVDGQGEEPIVGESYSWWDMSNALRSVDGSAPNPSLVEIVNPTTSALMYRITLHNTPKFNIKLSSTPGSTACPTPGAGFIVWGVTILTPSVWTNSQGIVMSPYTARNTDGLDPGEGDDATCGVIACNTISTGDDDIALKGGHNVNNLVIAHNHFGSGHGMSIGSETYTGVHDIDIYDLTIDADSRSFGAPPSDYSDFNGIRVKSDLSRGGTVDNVTYSDICVRDIVNTILIDTEYNPLFAGVSYPNFGSITFHDFHSVNCMAASPPVVTLGGFNTVWPAGPITLDNVVVDGLAPQAVFAQFANITLGPGNVNFTPTGEDVNVTNNISGQSNPIPCTFPPLPTAVGQPPGWLW